MNIADLTRLLRQAHTDSGLSVWELSRRANVKEHLVETAVVDVGRVPVEALSRLADVLGLELSVSSALTSGRRTVQVMSMVDQVLERVSPGSVEVVRKPTPILAVRFEGVLVCGATDYAPRSGLFRFLELCRSLVSRIFVLTELSKSHFAKVADRLARDRHVPPWFVTVGHARRAADILASTNEAFSEAPLLFVVDITEPAVDAVGAACWIPFVLCAQPKDRDDDELETVFSRLAELVLRPGVG